MRIISVITALTLGSILCAQEPAKVVKLSDNPIYKEGISALKDHLPSIASKKFSNLLESGTKDKTLGDKDKLALLFLLAEAQIRDLKPDDALATLTDPLITKHPDAVFWKGQALATSGRYNDAIEMLERAVPESKNYTLAQIKIATLATALNDIDKALSTLSLSVKGQDANKVRPQTYLSLANLYLEKDDAENASLTLKKITATDEVTTKAKQVIQAQIDILKKAYPEVIKSLDAMVKAPENLDRRTLSYATLHLADALHLSGQTQEGINTLVSYLDKHPNSPQLGPMFSRLSEWIPDDVAITDSSIKKLIAWSGRDKVETTDELSETEEEQSDLKTFAHYYYARHLAHQAEADSKTKAIFELNLLRLRYPTHILAGTSLTDTASTQLALGRIEPAKRTLKLIQKLNIPIAPIAKQQAAFLLGKLNLDEKDYPAAAAAFQTVVDNATKKSELQTASIINAATAYLASADEDGFHKLENNIDDSVIQTNLLLECALWLANKKKTDARSTLLNFTHQHSDHPRINEARLALALNCLNISPVDLELCQSIISDISKNDLRDSQHAQYSYLIYRNAATHMDYAGAADAARQFTETFPEHPRTPQFTLLQGQALYHNGQHNEARRILLNLTKAHPEHPLKNYAEYYTAMSAKLEGTPQSQEESIVMFSKIAAEKSDLATESLLQLSQLYMKKNQPQLAVEKLKPEFDVAPEGEKPLKIGVLLASSYHALGVSEPESVNFQLALDIFDTLIAQSVGNPQAINQLKYHKALTLQHMNRDDDALEIYYSVINIDTEIAPITEWKWYFECGFKAIAMLKDMKNPNGAIAVAKKLSNSKGYRAKEATDKARELEMKYMIWER